MRTRSTLCKGVFGAVVAGALGFGASAVTAGTASASEMVWCPAYLSSAQACTDCCWRYHQQEGMWDPATKWCECGW